MDWVRQRSSKKGVLLPVSLVWDGCFVSAAVHLHPVDDLRDSAQLDFTVLQSAAEASPTPKTPKPTHKTSLLLDHMDTTEPGGKVRKSEAQKNKKTRCPSGTRHRVVTDSSSHTHTRCTVYSTQPRSRQIMTVKKTLNKSTTWYLQINCTCGNKLVGTVSGKGRNHDTLHSINRKKEKQTFKNPLKINKNHIVFPVSFFLSFF